jgi:hypothetical protein
VKRAVYVPAAVGTPEIRDVEAVTPGSKVRPVGYVAALHVEYTPVPLVAVNVPVIEVPTTPVVVPEKAMLGPVVVVNDDVPVENGVAPDAVTVNQ